MIRIPNTDKKFSQPNRGDILGNLWSTFNIDLQDAPGTIRVGHRMKIISKTGDTNMTNLNGAPVGIVNWDGYMWCIGGNRICKSSGIAPNMTFAEDVNTNAKTTYSSDTDDLVNFNSTLVSANSTDGKLYSLDLPTSGTWTQRLSNSALAGVNLQMEYFKKKDRLYVSTGAHNRIISLDSSWNVSSANGAYDLSLTLSNDDGYINCMACSSDRIWVGMKRGYAGSVTDNGNLGVLCGIYEWDGESNQVTKEYKIPAAGVMAIILDNDIPVIIDTEGVVRKFDGTGFVEKGRLPLRRGESLLVSSSNYTANFIHPRGLAITKDHTLLALINNQSIYGSSSSDHIYEPLQSGIWEFDLNGSASHRNSFSLMGVSSTSVTDYGQNKISAVGSLGYIKNTSGSAYGITNIFAGASYFTDASTATYGIFMTAPSPTGTVTYPEGQKYGYYVTPFLQSSQIKDSWKGAWLKYKQLLDSGDKMVVKYRYLNADPIEFTLTWTSTTTFTTTTDLTAYQGYEVEVLQGKGSGRCSHITTVVNNSGTYTVTVDETYTGCTSGTAKARVQNWIRASDVTNQTTESEQFNFGIISERCQVKVCMQFTGDDEVHQLFIDNAVAQAI